MIPAVAWRERRIWLPAAGSFVINGLMIVAIVGLGAGSDRHTPTPAPRPMTVVTLAAPPEEAAPAAAAVVPPVTPSSAMVALAPAARPVPLLSIPVPRLAPPVVTIAPPLAPLPAAAIPVTMPAAAAIMSPAPPAPAMPRAATIPGPGAPDARGRSVAYAARVRAWLLAHRIYPRHARMRHQQGVVLVRFVLDRAGMLVTGEVVTPSGYRTLDQEAGAMLARASPYPTAPADLPGDHIELTAPIVFLLPG